MNAAATEARGARGELALVGAVGLTLALLVLPLPAPLLDVLLSANITFSLLVLFTVLATPAPREFTAFPSLLLFLTLYRLGLNVASSRLILLEGHAGRVIDAFGNFVVGGNLVVGIIVFTILLVVQFVVITKGAGRISEVAARFTLDGLPGKQMAIDADLNAGVIDGDEARRRRAELMKESEFYGAMDGASKFVRGDAVAGLVITIVNLLGGGILGLAQGMSLAEAARTYSILTVGDGLVAQVPALVVSISGALLVTKSSGEEALPAEFGRQLFSRPRTFLLVAAAALALALAPGLPAAPFLALALVVWLLGRGAERRRRAEERRRRAEEAREAAASGQRGETAAESDEWLDTDRILVEVGFRLVPVVQGVGGTPLTERIARLRKALAQELGLSLPPVRVRDSTTIDPSSYRILLDGEVIARGELVAGCLLALPPGDQAPPLQGTVTRDPALGRPALWIREAQRAEAERKGYTVVEPSAVLSTHLSRVVREHAHEILSRDDTKQRIDRLKEHAPALVEEVVGGPLSVGEVHKVLRNLLREGIPIKNLLPIFECLADHAGRSKDPDVLTELVRERMARTISRLHVGRDGVLRALTLDPALEQRLSEMAQDPNALGRSLRAVAERVREAAKKAHTAGVEPVLVVRPTLRRVLAMALQDGSPRVPVLAFSEIAGVERIEPVDSVTLEDRRNPEVTHETAHHS